MMIGDAFPSKYIKSDDLQGHRLPVTIMAVTMEDMGQGDGFKPLLRFMGKDKGMILNKTNATILQDAWGPDTDRWCGQKIEIYAHYVNFQGRQVQGIAVQPLGGQTAPGPVPPPAQVSINNPAYAQPVAPQQAQQPNPATTKPGPHDGNAVTQGTVELHYPGPHDGPAVTQGAVEQQLNQAVQDIGKLEDMAKQPVDDLDDIPF